MKLEGKVGGNITENEIPKQDNILDQLDSNIKYQLEDNVFGIINYNPLQFIIAYKQRKQVVNAFIKKSVKEDLDNPFKNEMRSITLSKIIIDAIPLVITRHIDPLGFSSIPKYTIKFVSSSNIEFTIKEKTIDEIVGELRESALVVIEYKAFEALSIIIHAFEKLGKMKINDNIGKPGFYLIKDYVVSNDSFPIPTKEEIIQCIDTLEILQSRHKKKEVFPTILKWSIAAPFDFAMKQKNNMYIPWLFLYGFPNTGKTTSSNLGNATYGHYSDESYNIPFTNVDTPAKLGESLSKSTYPLVINEAGSLSDEFNRFNKNLVEMLKTSITDKVARSKFVKKSIYTEIPAFNACIITSNSAPPSDLGFRRRILSILFTQEDEYSKEERKEFQKILNKQTIVNLKTLGNFTANYILKNQNIILDGKKDWNEISKTILAEMYDSVGLQTPEWINFIAQENIYEESKEDLDLVLRGYLINKINETYNKYHKSIDASSADVPNLSFENRLDFCLTHKLIPFLNTNKNKEILITSDLLNEIKKQRINHITSLSQIAKMMDGFEYRQKKLGDRNVRTAYGTHNQLIDFLGIEEKEEKDEINNKID